jgi:DNA-binding response OmpR family regulator
MKILIVEDEENILSFLQRGFGEEGYVVDCASDGEDGEHKAILNKYDVIILDWMLPFKNGVQIIESIRKQNIQTPVILLTARDETADKIAGLRKGADDYLTKPFSFEELLARVDALHRRNISGGNDNICFKDICINLSSKIIEKDGIIVDISAKEYDLLLFLVKNKNCVVSSAMISEGVWSDEEFVNSNVIQVMIYRLRKKLGKDVIKSSRGLGYKIEI